MSVIDHNRSVPLGAVSAFGVVALFERAVDALVSWRRAHATAKTLRALSDQQLADIGLERADIDDVAGIARR